MYTPDVPAGKYFHNLYIPYYVSMAVEIYCEC